MRDSSIQNKGLIGCKSFVRDYCCHKLNIRDLLQMDARNLAIVFGPTLIKSKDDDMTSIIRDMSDQCRIIESIILHVSKKNCVYIL